MSELVIGATPIQFHELGAVQSIEDAEHRLGTRDRVFVIENQWEFDRCKILLPKLPAVDLRSESLLVLMSWKSAQMSLNSAESIGDKLKIELNQDKSAREKAGSYEPPEFLIFKLPHWDGPIEFEVNGEARFTVFRGALLEARAKELWGEILRIHSGGRPNLDQEIRHYRRMWPNSTYEEVRELLVSNKEKYHSIDRENIYRLLFHDLIDAGAKPAVPRIFALIESMGKHDKAFGPACDALVGVGGPEVVEQSEKALDSWNPESRQAAMGVLGTLALPETRELAREKLVHGDGRMTHGAMNLLRRLGVRQDDVPAMIDALTQIEQFYLGKTRRKFVSRTDEMSNSVHVAETAHGIIYALGELGPKADAAVSVLERFATDARLPQPGYRAEARRAIEQIQGKVPAVE
jgi:hypothetical protein